MRRIYLDYASTTPVDPAVLKAMEPYFSSRFGNAGSVHSFGQEAVAAVDASRETISKSIGAKFSEIIFTGSATEANNLVLRGCVSSVKCQVSSLKKPRIIISAVEHESILATARDLEREGVETVIVPVDKKGLVDLKKLEAALNEHTILVSVMYANNEVGTMQPITEIAGIIRAFRNNLKLKIKNSKLAVEYPLLHTDATQAFPYLDCNVDTLGVDFMTLSAHKIYGPKGIGCLYVRGLTPQNKILRPIITGGGQELTLRSGTQNVPLIVGFAKAVELIAKSREKESVRIAKLREDLWDGIKKIYPKAEVNGMSAISDKRQATSRLPNNLNVYLPGIDSQFFLTKLDLAGVAASSGSACSARALTPSYVIEALGHSKERAKQSVRFTLGRPTTKTEIDKVAKILKQIF